MKPSFINDMTREAFEKHNSDFGERYCQGTCLIEWYDAGEGWNGDYDPEDKNDVALLRFDVYAWDNDQGWMEVEDASYCTQVPVDTPPLVRQYLLEILMEEIGPEVDQDHSVKKICERLSWIEPDWAKSRIGKNK
jgi:hypothetical protein